MLLSIDRDYPPVGLCSCWVRPPGDPFSPLDVDCCMLPCKQSMVTFLVYDVAPVLSPGAAPRSELPKHLWQKERHCLFNP